MTPQEKHDRSLFKNIGDETTLEDYLPQLVAIEKAANEKWFAAAAALRQAQEDCEKARAEWDVAMTERIQLKWILDRNKFTAEHTKKWSKA
jgi:hypothetical protein